MSSMFSKEKMKSYTKKILAVLKLPEDQMELAMDYIYGAVGDEALEKFDYKDLTFLSSSKVAHAANTMQILVDRGDDDETRRLINVLFAIGQGTCCAMLICDVLVPHECERFFPAESEEMLYKYYVSFANAMVLSEYLWLIDDIHDFQKPDIELACMRRAMDCHTITDYGRSYLQVMYFKKKYSGQYVDSPADAWKNPGKIRIDKEDYPLLEAYENIMINSLGEILNNVSASALIDIQKAVRSDDMDKIYPLIRKYNSKYEKLMFGGRYFRCWSLPPVDYGIMLIGGLAYMSIPLSPVFNNIVHLCFRVNSVLMLCIVDELSQRDADIFNGDFANHFGIDTRVFIRWLANRSSRYRNALQWQLQTNKDIYLEIAEEEIAHFDEGYEYSERTPTYMLELLRENDPDSYQSMLINAREKYMEQCMEVVASKLVESCRSRYRGEHLSDEEQVKLKAFLTGREMIDVIYPIAAEKAKKKYWYELSSPGHDGVRNFRKIFGDCGFTRRCAVVAAILGDRDYIGAEVSGVSEQVEKLFSGFEKEGLSVEYQVIAGEVLNNAYKDTVKCIFERYLKEKREETLAGFYAWRGQHFGLAFMKENPEEYKQEIIHFVKVDTPSYMMDELFELLCRQKNWEDDIIALLSAKTRDQRAFAIEILMHWQSEGADYTDVFTSMLEREKSGKVRELLQTAIKSGKGV